MPDLLTTDEAASYLRLSERKLYELVANGAVPCTKVTGKWLFPKAALDRWQPLPWVTIVAADGSGDAYYADHSVVPHVTDEQFEACATPIGRVAAAQLGLTILDGSRSACDWGSGCVRSKSSGCTFPAAARPILRRS